MTSEYCQRQSNEIDTMIIDNGIAWFSLTVLYRVCGIRFRYDHSCQTALLSAGRSSLPCFTPFRESRTPQKKGIFENIPIKFKIYLKFSRKHKIVGIFGKIYPRCTRVKWNIRKIYPIYTRVEWTFSKLSYLRYTIYPKNISNLH